LFENIKTFLSSLSLADLGLSAIGVGRVEGLILIENNIVLLTKIKD
jgi:hypothetical protein